MELTTKLKLADVVKSRNIAMLLGEDDLREIALCVKTELGYDVSARADWDKTYAEAMKLALQVMENKSFPWPGAANVKFPLLTIAALNFHAKAYPTLLNGEAVVNYRVVGKDDGGEKQLRADRVGAHMNYQLLEATDWEAGVDKALIVTPIMGCTFKKSYYDHDARTVVSRLILPQYLIVPYFTTDLESCPRISEVFSLNPNDFTSKVRRGLWLDVAYSPTYGGVTTEMGAAKQQAQHVVPVADPNWLPTEFIEQHRFLDLDGDGYAEPYIVTFVRETGQICRIVARFALSDLVMGADAYKDKIAYIKAQDFYEKMPFIPSPDGGFYDLGLGMLLGPLNHTVNTLLNQMLDAGTMQILGGGFLGRGVKIRKGDNTFKPYEWKSVECSGSSLRDNIVALPKTEPSAVMLQLLMYLVEYGERVGGANDIQMGEIPGQNVKAETMKIADANGSRMFAAIYKRWWRATKCELVRMYILMGRYIVTKEAVVLLEGPEIEPGDYALPLSGIRPVADPNVVSREELQRTALLVYNSAVQVPGQDVREATLRLYRAHNVPNPEAIWPDPKGPKAIPQQPNPKMLEVQVKQLEAETRRLGVVNANRIAIATLVMDVQESQAKITQLQADAALKSAQAQGEGAGHAIALIQTEIAAQKHHVETGLKIIELMQGAMKDADGTGASGAKPAGTGVDKLAQVANDPAILSLSAPTEGAQQGAVGAAETLGNVG